jgi:uncharacterized protein (TIGR02757 family)
LNIVWDHGFLGVMPPSLKAFLDHLYQTFDLSMLAPDPLDVVRRCRTPEDREVAGLIAASLAYGRAEHIVRTVEQTMAAMDDRPYRFTLRFDPARDAARFSHFVYRFTRGEDLVCLIALLQHALRTYGSLGQLFASGYQPTDPHIGPALTRFVETLLSTPCPSVYSDGAIPTTAGVRYLLPSPRSGSACKRLNLYLRWMVRRGDAIDFGLWRDISPAKLIIPLDTHVARIARLLRLTTRRQPDWAMAEETTDALRACDPDDPVKYDVALCHWGMQQARSHEAGHGHL